MGCTPPDAESLTVQPGPGYGDSIGGMTIAGGIMGALFHRERTGKRSRSTSRSSVSGLWAMGPTVALSLQLGMPWRPPPTGSGAGGPSNPLVGTYRTQDGGFIALSCLQGFHYWPGACRAIGREDLIADDRFASNELLATNANAAPPFSPPSLRRPRWPNGAARLAGFDGQWSVAQDTLEAVADPQVEANGYVLETVNAAGVPFSLVTAPVQFSGAAATAQTGTRVQRASRRGAGRAGLRHRCHSGSGGGGCRGLRAGDIDFRASFGGGPGFQGNTGRTRRPTCGPRCGRETAWRNRESSGPRERGSSEVLRCRGARHRPCRGRRRLPDGDTTPGAPSSGSQRQPDHRGRGRGAGGVEIEWGVT